MAEKDKALRRELTRYSRLLYEKGMANAYEGNLSARQGKSLWITPGGVCKGILEPSMLVRMGLDGQVKQCPPSCKPSSESLLHLAVYRLCGRAGAVVHAHPPYATSYAVRGKPIESGAYPEMRVLFDRIPILPYGRPSTDAVWAGLPEVIDAYDVFLLSNHGLVAVGATVEEAFYRLESAESVAKVLYLTELRGGAAELPGGELDALRAMYDARRARS